nr:unnamed protein product [Digitaria exilis]
MRKAGGRDAAARRGEGARRRRDSLVSRRRARRRRGINDGNPWRGPRSEEVVAAQWDSKEDAGGGRWRAGGFCLFVSDPEI